MKQTDTATAALVQHVQEQFGTDIETAENAVRKMQKALSAAMKVEKNTANESGVKHNIKTLPNGNKYVQADRQVIFGNDPESWSEQLENYINGKSVGERMSNSLRMTEMCLSLLKELQVKLAVIIGATGQE